MSGFEKAYAHVKHVIDGRADLTVVTKKRSLDDMMFYYNKGERCFGENHAQELLDKAEKLPSDIQWQFIGHLQRNKVKAVAPVVSRVQSLDSIELAQTIDKECRKINKVMPCLIEFHLALEDENKTGLAAEDADSFYETVNTLSNIEIQGIMVMGPHTDDKNEIRRVFTQAHDLYLHLQNQYGKEHFHILSMGMSADYEIAVECGSNMVRIGTYLFTKEEGE